MKDTKYTKLTDSTSEEEFNFSFDNPNDRDDGFSFDYGADTSGKNRSPITSVKAGASKILGSAYDTFVPNVQDKIQQSMPDATKFYGDVISVASGLKGLGSEFQRELGPSLLQLKRAGRTLAPQVKKFLPEKLGKLYDKIVADTSQHGPEKLSPSKETLENQTIAANLEGIFSSQLSTQVKYQQAQYEDQKADTIIDRQLQSQRHETSTKQLSSIETSLAFQQKFIEKIQIPYMKKDLELKYRHYFVAKDTLGELKGFVTLVEQQLSQIRHNTALPEIQKVVTGEQLKKVNSERFNTAISNWLANTLKNIRENVISPTVSNVNLFAEMADMYASGVESDSMMGSSGGNPLVNTGLSFFGSGLGQKAAKQVGKLLYGKSGKANIVEAKAAQMNNIFKNMMTRLILKGQKFAEYNEGGFLGNMATAIFPSLKRGAGETTNVLKSLKPNDPAQLTNQAVLSITTIMPGYLAKINKHLESLATGKPAEELIFDVNSNDFIKASTIAKKVQAEAFGTSALKNAAYGTMIGKIRGMYKVDVKDSIQSFDDLQDDLRIWLTNSILLKYDVEPKALAAYAGMVKKSKEAGDDDFDVLTDVDADPGVDAYIKGTFNNVKNPEGLLNLLVAMLFTADGKIDRQNVSNLSDILITGMRNQGYLDVFDRYVDSGLARYLKDYIKGSGATFKYNDEAIRRELLSDVRADDDQYKSALTYGEEKSIAFQNLLRENTNLSAMANDENWQGGLIGMITKLASKRRKKQEEEGKENPDLLDQEELSFLKKYLPKSAYEYAEGATKKFRELGGKFSENAAANRLKKLSLERLFAANEDEFDPYSNLDLTDDEVSGRLGGRRRVGGTKSKGGGSGKIKLDTKTILPVRVMNFSELEGKFNLLIDQLKSGKIDTSNINKAFGNLKFDEMLTQMKETHSVISNLQVSAGSQKEVVSAITHFEQAFIDFANSQKDIPELLSQSLATLGALTVQMDGLLYNTSSTIKKLAKSSWTKITTTASGIKTRISNMSVEKILASAAEKSKEAREFFGTRYRKTKRAIGSAWSGGKEWLGAVYDDQKLKWDERTDRWMKNVGQWKQDARNYWDTNKEAWSDYWRDKYSTTKASLFGENNVIRKARKYLKVDKYIDIYRKDEVDPGNPLLSAVKQEEGVYFVDSGKKVLASVDITSPVMEKTEGDKIPRILITRKDIEHGLVDVNNDPISLKSTLFRLSKDGIEKLKDMGGKKLELLLKGLGKFKDGAKWLGGAGMSLWESLTGEGSITDRIGTMFKNIKSGVTRFGKRLFGLDDDSLPLTKGILNEVVGKRLDTIIKLMKARYGVADGEELPESESEMLERAHEEEKREEKEKADKESNSAVMSPTTSDSDADGGLDTIFEMRERETEQKQKSEKTEREAKVSKSVTKIEKILSGDDKSKKGLLSLLSPLKFLLPIAGGIAKVVLGVATLPMKLGGLLVKILGKLGLGGLKLGAGALGGLGKMGFGLGRKLMRNKYGRIALGVAGALGLNKMFSGDDEEESQEVMETDANELMSGDSAYGGMDVNIPGLHGATDLSTGVIDKSQFSNVGRGVTGSGGMMPVGDNAIALDNAKEQKKYLSSYDGKVSKENGLVQLGEESAGGQGPIDALLGYAEAGAIGKVAGAVLTRVAPRLLGTLAGIGTGPVGWAILGLDVIDSVFFRGKFKAGIGNYLGVGTDSFLEARMALYGIPGKEASILGTLKNLIGGSIYSQTANLEETIYDLVSGKGKSQQMSDSDFVYWAGKFGFDTEDPNQVKYFVTWLTQRFVPVFKMYLMSLKEKGYTLKDAYSLSDDIKNKLLADVQRKCGNIASAANPLKCSVDAYKKLSKQLGLDTESQASLDKQTKSILSNLAKERRDATIEEQRQIASSLVDDEGNAILPESLRKKTEEKVESTDKNSYQLEMAATGGIPMGTGLAPKKFDSLAAQQAAMQELSKSTGQGFATRGPGKLSIGNMGNSTVDMSSIPPSAKPPKGDEKIIGSFVATHESGKEGSAAIGYDREGGTSYGTYQLSSVKGSLREFVLWCKDKAPEVYKTLMPNIQYANTGSRNGAFPDLWRALVKKGAITFNLEYEYYKTKFYNVALRGLRKLSPNAAQLVESNRALQESLWSTAVQHGQYISKKGRGAPEIFAKVYKENMGAEDFLKAIYTERSGRFPNSTADTRASVQNRFKRELGEMLALSKKFGGGLGNTAPVSPSDSGSGYAGDASSVPAAQSVAVASATAAAGGASGLAAMTSTGGGNFGGSSTSMSMSGGSAGGGDVSTMPKGTGQALNMTNIQTTGGVDLENLAPATRTALDNLAASYNEKFGQKLKVTSGKRSMAKQAELYRKYGPGRAARPNPLSPHISGLAFDMDSSQANQAAKAGLFDQAGLWRPLLKGLGRTQPEPWHVEVKGSRNSSMKITPQAVAAAGTVNPSAGATSTPSGEAGREEQAEVQTAGGQTGGGMSTPSGASIMPASAGASPMGFGSTDGGGASQAITPEIMGPASSASSDYSSALKTITDILSQMLQLQAQLPQALANLLSKAGNNVVPANSIFTKDRDAKSAA